MRPIRLELSSFTAFRDTTVVDFADADIFALVGSTGAGKSSVIDAICFALYGSVPRYEDRRLVAPVISQGKNEARVRFDFTVAGDAYTAVRVVRRTKSGASTKEARLECPGGEVLAGDADELSTRVAALIGLDYDHFTKCVVLPQGHFARFLHDKPRDRQDLLVSLLDLDVYERMARLARQRAEATKNEGALIESRLDDLAFATPEMVEKARGRLEVVTALQADLTSYDARAGELDADLARLSEVAEQAAVRFALLEAVEVPEDVAGLGVQMAAARADREAAEHRVADAECAHDAAATAAGDDNRRTALEDALRNRERWGELQAELRFAEDALREVAAACDGAEESDRRAQVGLELAEGHLETLRDAHRAHVLAKVLRPGEECPVCLRPVETVPELDEPAGLEEAQKAVAAARMAVDAARDAGNRARDRRAGRLAARDRLRDEIATLDARLDSAPTADAAKGELERLGALGRKARRALDELRAARDTLGAARAGCEALDATERTARAAYDETRDALAAFEPPRPDHRDLAEDWAALAGWAGAQAPDVRGDREKALALVREAEASLRDLSEWLARSFETAGVRLQADMPPSACTQAVAGAVADAGAELRRVEEALEQVRKLRRQREDALERERVAAQLARHLGARGFEKWVLDEVLDVLAADATVRLRELSDGQYSLTLDEKNANFAVVDHRNADEVRSARTLSGGETFLASLALALALSDRIADLATAGSARLDAIFLDEGFGTLDPETLDIVAAAIEDLGARGRTVGIVTHVRDLAERVPVRFEVRKGPRTSSIERVSS